MFVLAGACRPSLPGQLPFVDDLELGRPRRLEPSGPECKPREIKSRERRWEGKRCETSQWRHGGDTKSPSSQPTLEDPMGPVHVAAWRKGMSDSIGVNSEHGCHVMRPRNPAKIIHGA